ncbi:MAG: MarR family transcriptional regulator [Thermofilaceae archaeon]
MDGKGVKMLGFNRNARAATEALLVIAYLLISAGLPRSSAIVLAALYLFSQPLSSKELIRITGYSKSAISAATRMLESKRLIARCKHGREFAYKPQTTLGKALLELHASILERARRHVAILLKNNNLLHELNLASIENELNSLLNKFAGELNERN